MGIPCHWYTALVGVGCESISYFFSSNSQRFDMLLQDKTKSIDLMIKWEENCEGEHM